MQEGYRAPGHTTNDVRTGLGFSTPDSLSTAILTATSAH